jgi:hypothetical protein
LIGSSFQTDSDECNLVQSASSLCGCPIPEGACYLCGEGASVQQPNLQVPYLLDIEGLTPTCEFIEAYLHSLSETDSTCGVSRDFTASYCGCPESPPLEGPMCTLCPRGEAVPDANRTLSIEGIPFETCGEAEQAAALYLSQASDTCNLFQSVSSLFCGCETLSSVESPCSLCPDGSPVSLPDEDLSVLLAGFSGSSIGGGDLGGVQPTCQVVEAFAKSFEEGSGECLDVQFIAGVCGCPPVENACDFCPGEDVAFPDKKVRIAATVIDVVPTCSQIDAALTQFENGSDFCSLAKVVNFICGCQGGERIYFGAETQGKKAALVWVSRISAALSLFGSSMIVYDILRDKKKRGSVFHTLMLAMSFFDIFGSIAWGLATLPIPASEFGEPSGVYGAKGNEKTCKTQGFFIQLGYTSLFYNMSLSFYFLMVVRYGMRENQIKKLQLWLHVPALIVGFALAFGGIPLYQNHFFGCYIATPPLAEDYRDIVIFAMVPICTAIALATVNMLLVYRAVRQQMIAARKWRVSRAVLDQGAIKKSSLPENADESSSLAINPDVSGVCIRPRRLEKKRETVIEMMERKTFWQALFYLGAFYLTWPILLASQLSSDAQSIYPFMLVVFILAPLQGFLNFLVYARPRIQNLLQERQKIRQGRQRASKGTTATSEATPSTSEATPATSENTASGAFHLSSACFDLGKDATATSKNTGPGARRACFDLGNAIIPEEEEEAEDRDEEDLSITQNDISNTHYDNYDLHAAEHSS